MITYAVVGHNEAALLVNALEQAFAARREGEPVWFVDSASTDGSGELARAVGADVVGAPLGKGRAVATAVERCETQYICIIDADGVRRAITRVEQLAPAPEACRQSIEVHAQARFLERIGRVLEAERALALS